MYNGYLEDSPLIEGRLCGELRGKVIESSGPFMRVVFQTDGSVSRGGFTAHYTSLNDKGTYAA